jgi:hypothetical protein
MMNTVNIDSVSSSQKTDCEAATYGPSWKNEVPRFFRSIDAGILLGQNQSESVLHVIDY